MLSERDHAVTRVVRPGRPFCHSHAEQGTWLHHRRGADPGSRHWRQQRGVQPRERAAAAATERWQVERRVRRALLGRPDAPGSLSPLLLSRVRRYSARERRLQQPDRRGSDQSRPHRRRTHEAREGRRGVVELLFRAGRRPGRRTPLHTRRRTARQCRGRCHRELSVLAATRIDAGHPRPLDHGERPLAHDCGCRSAAIQRHDAGAVGRSLVAIRSGCARDQRRGRKFAGALRQRSVGTDASPCGHAQAGHVDRRSRVSSRSAGVVVRSRLPAVQQRSASGRARAVAGRDGATAPKRC